MGAAAVCCLLLIRLLRARLVCRLFAGIFRRPYFVRWTDLRVGEKDINRQVNNELVRKVSAAVTEWGGSASDRSLFSVNWLADKVVMDRLHRADFNVLGKLRIGYRSIQFIDQNVI